MSCNSRSDSFYTDFSCFVEQVLLERKQRELPVEVWMAAASAFIGASTLPKLVRSLGLGHLANASTLSTALFPGLGAVAGIAAGLSISNLLSNKKDPEKTKVSRELKKAEALFNSYNELKDEELKSQYIDGLFEDVVVEKRLVK